MTFQTFTPIEYLKIDVAGSYGLDKKKREERISWFDQNESKLLLIPTLDQRGLRLNKLMKQADSPALFYAGIEAYAKAKRGEPISYPISLDATASGAQIYAIVIGCGKSARLCNVIDTGEREDLYTNVFEGIIDRLVEQNAGNVTRDDAKQAVMTALYGSKAQPRKVFGEGPQLQAFYRTMEEDAPGIWELTEAMLSLWNPEALDYAWTMPDNFHVKFKVMDQRIEYTHFFNSPVKVTTNVNRPTEEGRSLGANTAHSIDGFIVREVSRRCSYDKDKLQRLLEILVSGAHWACDKTREQDILLSTLLDRFQETGFLSARVLEIVDEQNIAWFKGDSLKALEDLVKTLPEKPFPVLTTHDCFRVHPNYANDLRRTYNQVLHEIAKSNMLQSIVSQIYGSEITVNKHGDLSAAVLEANYALS